MKQPDDTPPASPENQLPPAATVAAALHKQGNDEDTVALVLWLLDYAASHGLTSRGQVGELLDVDGSTISKLLSGQYTAVPSMRKRIERFRGKASCGVKAKFPFAALKITAEIASFLDLTRRTEKICILWGRNRSGKTVAASHYAAQERDERTFYVRMPRGGGTKLFMQEWAKACGISMNKSVEELRGCLLRFFREGDLVIIDEMHQALPPIARTLNMVTIETIREVHDLCGIGIALVGTHVFHDAIESEKSRYREFMGQIANRAPIRRCIPLQPFKADVMAVAHAYELPALRAGEVRDKVWKLASERGIGGYGDILQLARNRANRKKETFAWSHVITIIDSGESWERGDVLGKNEDKWPEVSK